MNFSQALDLLKQGKKLQRENWNGKDQFVVMQKAYPQGIPANKQTAEAYNMKEGDLFKVAPYLQLRAVNGTHYTWVPSINDLFAEDWATL